MHYNYYKPSILSVFGATFIGGVFATAMVMSIISYCSPNLMTQSLRIIMMVNAVFMPCYTSLYTWSTEKDLSQQESTKRRLLRFVFVGLYLIALALIIRYLQ